MTGQDKRIMLKLQNLCIKKECCVKDIMLKAIKAFEGDTNKATLIVNQLIEDKFIDNFRYASAYAREKSAIAGWGKIKIARYLSLKGISQDTINLALQEIEETKANDKLQKVLITKYNVICKDKNAKLKLLRFALSRGYSYDDVKLFINKLFDNIVDN